ncbi:MAG TPA: DUF1801 domain-containing protein [Clostridia bacterium]|nr:DUF1801 domain-containing protein [Clostridia bacterium]
MNQELLNYSAAFKELDKQICMRLTELIEQHLPQAKGKIWHGSPVWFLEENPVVGYSKLKDHVQLLFWSGQSFEEAGLSPVGKHKAAEAVYTDPAQIDPSLVAGWLRKAEQIQWDYKNIVKRNGELIRLK